MRTDRVRGSCESAGIQCASSLIFAGKFMEEKAKNAPQVSSLEERASHASMICKAAAKLAVCMSRSQLNLYAYCQYVLHSSPQVFKEKRESLVSHVSHSSEA